jgi:hypothetical protein
MRGLPAPVLWGGLALLLLGGWLGILQINRWNFGPPVFFLCTGWLAVLLTGRFLWTTGMAVAEADDSAAEAEFWRAEGPRDELLREKRSLLKAIKEIEFDHQMGKMSDTDAEELSTFYRSRAIEIIKALEREQDGSRELSVAEKIQRELKARMSLHQVTAKAKAKAEDTMNSKAADAATAEKTADAAVGPDAGKDASPDTSKSPEAAEAGVDDDSVETTDEGDARLDETDDDETDDETASDSPEDMPEEDAEEMSEQPKRAKAEVGS